MRKLIPLIMIHISISINSQKGFKQGYIIDSNSDTIYGYIDYRGDLLNGKRCKFSKYPDSSAIIYMPGEIQAYRFKNNKFYISKEVIINKQSKMVFLEYILNGKADLYFHRDDFGDHYFIEQSGKIVELTNKMIEYKNFSYTKSYPYYSSNRHIGILKSLFSDCNEIQNEIENTQLSHKSLTKITKKYHNYVCTDEKCIVYEKKELKIKFNIAPLIGTNIESVKFYINTFYSQFQFKNSISPSVGLLLRSNIPYLNENLSVELSTIINRASFNSEIFKEYDYTPETEFYDITLDYLKLNNTLGVTYTYPRFNIKPYCNISTALCFITNSKSTINSRITNYFGEANSFISKDDAPIPSILIGYHIKTGFKYKLNNNKEFTLNYMYNNIQNDAISPESGIALMYIWSNNISLGITF